MFPLTVNGLGEVRIAVAGDEAEAATRLIARLPGERRVRARRPRSATSSRRCRRRLGYRFRDRGMLEHALTHRSRANEDVTGGVTDNESLEFLGDAVLGLRRRRTALHAVPRSRRRPEVEDEGGARVHAGARAAGATGSASASTCCSAAARRRPAAGASTRCWPTATRRSSRRSTSTAAIDAARAFILREFEPLVGDVAGAVTIGDDHKSALQEVLQGRGDPLPEYVVTAEEGPAHRRLFRIEVRLRGDVLAEAEGRTKKDAEQEAARGPSSGFSRGVAGPADSLRHGVALDFVQRPVRVRGGAAAS